MGDREGGQGEIGREDREGIERGGQEGIGRGMTYPGVDMSLDLSKSPFSKHFKYLKVIHCLQWREREDT